MNKKEIQNNITLRLANQKDCKKNFYLSNDPEVRRNSLNQDKIVFKNHKNWFTQKINDPHYIFLIAEIQGKFAGQVRFEVKGCEALTSTSLHKRFRGYGLGKFILKKGLEFLKQNHPEILLALGEIKSENIAAIKNSEFAGFKFKKESHLDDQQILYFTCDMNKDLK